MSSPMALVTGAASGIGLALTHHLLSKSYRVIMADLPSSSGSHLVTTLSLKNQVIFLPTDVSSWSSQLELFKQAYEWNGGRLDVLFSNAGVADVANLAEVELQEDEHGDLKNPDLRPLDVNLVGTIYAVMLFKHFVKKSRRDGGKVVITASGAGQYGMPSHPVYCASKHGLVGLTRSLGLTFKKLHGISVNCIVPGFVVIGITIPPLVAVIPNQHVTPMETMMRGFDLLLDGEERTGAVLEVSIDKVYFRDPVGYVDESMRWLVEDSAEFFARAFGQSA